MLLGSRSMPFMPVLKTTSAGRQPALHQQVVDGVLQLVRLDAQPDRKRALGVEIHQQHPAAVLGQRRAQVDGRRGLADAALLVADRDHPGRAMAQQRLGVRKALARAPGGPDRAGHEFHRVRPCHHALHLPGGPRKSPR